MLHNPELISLYLVEKCDNINGYKWIINASGYKKYPYEAFRKMKMFYDFVYIPLYDKAEMIRLYSLGDKILAEWP